MQQWDHHHYLMEGLSLGYEMTAKSTDYNCDM